MWLYHGFGRVRDGLEEKEGEESLEAEVEGTGRDTMMLVAVMGQPLAD